MNCLIISSPLFSPSSQMTLLEYSSHFLIFPLIFSLFFDYLLRELLNFIIYLFCRGFFFSFVTLYFSHFKKYFLFLSVLSYWFLLFLGYIFFSSFWGFLFFFFQIFVSLNNLFLSGLIKKFFLINLFLSLSFMLENVLTCLTHDHLFLHKNGALNSFLIVCETCSCGLQHKVILLGYFFGDLFPKLSRYSENCPVSAWKIHAWLSILEAK